MKNHRTAAAQHTLLPRLIDDLALSEPDTLWGLYPTAQNNYGDGFSRITYRKFATAVDGIAHRFDEALGGSKHGQVLAYLAPSDARCTMSLVAAMKSNSQLFLMSERNSVAGQIKLLDDLQCSVLVTTDTAMSAVQAVLKQRQLTVIGLPALAVLMKEPREHYGYDRSYSDTKDDTAFIVHTSGSTGFPKPMRISHKYISRAANNIGLPAPEGYDMLSDMTGGNTNILLLPLGHPAGVQFGLFNPFFNATTVILPLSNAPPTPDTLLEMLQHTHADWATLAPLTLQALSKDDRLIDQIAKRLNMILFSGGSLPNVFGDALAKKIKLTSLLGSSESGPLSLMYHKDYDFKSNWNYMQVHPAVGAVFDPMPGGIAELVFKRSAESEDHQTVFTLFPELTEFRTRDLFTQHNDNPNLWTHASRSDDIIVFLNGEKVNPIAFESQVSKHADISSAVMFGAQRFEAGVLIELTDTVKLTSHDVARAIERIWPTIKEANRLVPGYAQVSQSHVCFTDPETPILRTLKGTLRRKETLRQHSAKIEKLYSDADQIWALSSGNVPQSSEEELRKAIRATLSETLSVQLSVDDDDLFSAGMDSLQALRLAQRLRVDTGLMSIQPSLIYLHPSVKGLAQAIIESAQHAETSQREEVKSRQEMIKHTFQKFAVKIDELKATTRDETHTAQENREQVILLTGSTGQIGAYLLKVLMSRTSVKHIYCLNRAVDSQDLQTERNKAIDPTLPTEFPATKVTFLTADFSNSTNLGLSKSVYNELQHSVTHVIHNAWMVNFNLPLSAFEPMLDSIIALVSLCFGAPLPPNFAFISSISVTFDHGTAETVSESLLSAPALPPASGYSESKHVAENLLQCAAETLNMGPCVVLRIGQVAGPRDSPGIWNTSDWVASLVRSSRHLEIIPGSLSIHGQPAIDWLPIDDAAEIIAEIGLGSPDKIRDSVMVCHPLNPNRTTWNELLPSILRAAGQSADAMEVVKPEVWLARLKASASEGLDEASVEKNPALRLVGFWETLFARNTEGVTWSSENAQQMSSRLSQVGKIRGEWMEKWCRQWLD